MSMKIIVLKINDIVKANLLNSRIGRYNIAIKPNNLKYSTLPIDSSLELELDCSGISGKEPIEIVLKFIEGSNQYLSFADNAVDLKLSTSITNGKNSISILFNFYCKKEPNQKEKFQIGVKIPQINELIRVISLEDK